MAESQTSEQKSNSKVSGISRKDVISGLIGAGILSILSVLWGLQGRVSTLEARVDDLREIILRKVVTETITVTHTTTSGTITPPIAGYPFESILAGLLLGLLVVLLIHRSR